MNRKQDKERSILVTCILACGALIAGVARASTNADARAGMPESVTMDYCVARAMAVAETKGLFDAELALAQADRTAARARSYPHLNVIPDVRYYVDNAGFESALSADLGEHFLELPQNRLHREIARRNIARARLQQTGLQCKRQAHTIRAYVGCLTAKQELDLAHAECTRAETANEAWGKVATRTGEIIEQREGARVALQSARAALEQAGLLYRQTRRRLAEFCDMPEEADFKMEPPPEYELPPVTLADCLSWATANHSDLSGAQHEIESTELMVKLARMGRHPTPGLSFGYTDRGQSEFDNQDSGPYGAVFLRIPLWDAGETRANVERLQARLSGLQVDVRQLQSTLETRVTSAFLALKRAVSARDTARSDSKPERALRAAEIGFKNGQISRMVLEAAQMDWARHTALLLERNWNCYSAQADLQQTIEASGEKLRAGLQQARTGTGEQ